MAQAFYPTATQIIDSALIELRALDPEGSLTPTTTMRTNALFSLNLMVTSWQAKGMQVWCQKNGSLTMVASTSSYTVGPSGAVNIQRPLSIQQAWLHHTTDNTDPIPLKIIGREEYNSYTTKASESTPYALYYDPQYDLPGSNSGASAKGKIYLLPTPSTSAASTYTVQFVYTRPIQDFSSVSDSLDFPQEWYNAVKWNLMVNIMHGYGLPVMTMDRIKSQAKEELDLVSGWDREEGSSFIFPSQE